jgi:hypothetical protein
LPLFAGVKKRFYATIENQTARNATTKATQQTRRIGNRRSFTTVNSEQCQDAPGRRHFLEISFEK